VCDVIHTHTGIKGKLPAHKHHICRPLQFCFGHAFSIVIINIDGVSVVQCARIWRRMTNSRVTVIIAGVEKQLILAMPLIVVNGLQFILQVISLMFIGHLRDQLAFSGTSIATSFASVTAFSLMVYMRLMSLPFISLLFTHMRRPKILLKTTF